MEAALELHNLSFVQEGDEVVVGRLDTGSYAVFPVDGAELLHRIAEGMTVSQASAWYEASFGEPVDVHEFVTTLTDLGFVREGGTQPDPVEPVRLRWLGRAMFSPAAWVCYGVVVALWALAVRRDSAIAPHPAQIFFVRSLLIVQVVITIGQTPLLFAHEGFHVLAGRRLGLPTRLGISNRLSYIVFETRLNGLMSVPRRARYLPFIAGLVCDVLIFCVLDLTAELTRNGTGSFSLVGRICLAIAFTVVLRMAWQLQLHLRTDLYYVFATALNCHDLHDASVAMLRNRIWRALGRTHRITDEQQWTEHDRKTGLFYGPFLILVYVTLVLIAVFGTLPVVRVYGATIISSLLSGTGNARFWDSLLSVILNLTQVVVLLVLARRKRRELAGRRPRLLLKEAD
ncbi:MAG TPA: hypothetical protein VFQ44_05380 [Streptosporangiaceae bacterium]|nr:hypothetical protein [Streptosporangiaceae bacterium]